ncbi:MAG: SDR family oxidoreductase [Planctomycetota bacterium]|jgi:NADH dehydrogenase
MATFTITGAFGYSGRYITAQLLDAGHAVRTLTGSPRRAHPFGDAVEVFPLDFGCPEALACALDGADVLINTYWIRFSAGGFAQHEAVRNTRALFQAAEHAGVKRIVHVSITNPAADSPYEYFRGKAELEAALQATRLDYSVLRPAVLFGGPGILLNNIAWMLRRFPVFGLFGDGRYRLQPIHVADFAELAVREAGCTGRRIVDAVGPETFTYRALVEAIGAAIGRPRPLVAIPAWAGLAVAKWVGWWLGDVLLTREEIGALMDDLLCVPDAPPAGHHRLTDWLGRYGAELGTRYANELTRRHDREREYARL